jgi:hypothetical protein
MGVGNSKDMAIGFVFFNPAKSKRMLMNYLYVWNHYKTRGLPVFTLELVFGDREPEIKKAFHVRGNSHMFHKERLCRLLEERIPKKYKKIVFLDADIVFDDDAWYAETSKLLDTHDVVQPFEYASWLDLTYTKRELTRESAVKMPGNMWDFKYHPGFAWAFRREWYNEVGFYDWAVSGSGDTLSSAKWLNKKFPEKFKSLPHAMRRSYATYVRNPSPTVAYRKGGSVSHLYHGSRSKRQYAERHKLLDVNEDIKDMIRINSDGVYEWKIAKWNTVFYEYFKNREDDDLSEDVRVTVTRTS